MPRSYLVICIALSLILLWMFPLFRLVPIATSERSQEDVFDAGEFARMTWETALPASLSRAQDAAPVVRQLLNSPDAVREEYGISRGISRGFFLYIRGKGTISQVESARITIKLPGNHPLEVSLQTGPIFGNMIRDTIGVPETSPPLSSQRLNDVSGELNQIAERDVIAPLVASATVGKEIEFVGCTNIKDPQRITMPLSVVPVSFEWMEASP